MRRKSAAPFRGPLGILAAVWDPFRHSLLLTLATAAIQTIVGKQQTIMMMMWSSDSVEGRRVSIVDRWREFGILVNHTVSLVISYPGGLYTISRNE